MTDTERKELRNMASDVAQLKIDMALVHQSTEKFIEPTLASILEQVRSLSFYDKQEIDEKLRDIEDEVEAKLQTLQKRRWYENTISALAGSILTTVVTFWLLRIMEGN